MRRKLFISYSHEDAPWLRRLRQQLTVLEKAGLIETFADTDIDAGQEWFPRLKAEMTLARVALLLISAPFLGSAFIVEQEIPRLLARHAADGMVLYPLLIRDCPWQLVPWLARTQMRPTGVRPVAGRRGGDIDKCLADVAREIASLLNKGNGSAEREPVKPVDYVLHNFSGEDQKLQQTRIDLVKNIERICKQGLDEDGVAAVNALIIAQHNGSYQYRISRSNISKHIEEVESMYTHLLSVATHLKPTIASTDLIFALGRMKDTMLQTIETLARDK